MHTYHVAEHKGLCFFGFFPLGNFHGLVGGHILDMTSRLKYLQIIKFAFKNPGLDPGTEKVIGKKLLISK